MSGALDLTKVLQIKSSNVITLDKDHNAICERNALMLRGMCAAATSQTNFLSLSGNIRCLTRNNSVKAWRAPFVYLNCST